MGEEEAHQSEWLSKHEHLIGMRAEKKTERKTDQIASDETSNAIVAFDDCHDMTGPISDVDWVLFVDSIVRQTIESILVDCDRGGSPF
jgi:hypothetical protein